MTMLILLFINTLGPIVSFAATYTASTYFYQCLVNYIVYTVMGRICEALALYMFPQMWLHGLREYEISNEIIESNFFPGYDDQDLK